MKYGECGDHKVLTITSDLAKGSKPGDMNNSISKLPCASRTPENSDEDTDLPREDLL